MSASIYKGKSHLKYKIFFKSYILWKEAGRDVLLTISHLTMKTFCLLLPFILQFRASGKDPILMKAINMLQFWSRDGIQTFTGDLVLDLLILFFSPKLLMGFHSENKNLVIASK